MTRAAAAMLFAAALGACGQAPADHDAPVQAPAPASERAQTTPALQIDGNGLGEKLRFGAAKAEVVHAVTATQGAPTASRRIEECGEGPMDFVEFGGLSLGFQDGVFVGWFARSPFREKTVSGLAVGDPRSALGATVVEETTLGMEFRAPSEVSGILDERGQRIEALWAGSACLFR